LQAGALWLIAVGWLGRVHISRGAALHGDLTIIFDHRERPGVCGDDLCGGVERFIGPVTHHAQLITGQDPATSFFPALERVAGAKLGLRAVAAKAVTGSTSIFR
jgi:hypothetical protein